MDAKVIKPFEAEINGVTIKDEAIYRTMCYLLDNIEDNFDECYNKKFVEDLDEAIYTILTKYEDASNLDIEREFTDSIDDAESFEDLRFLMWGDDYKFEFLNKNRWEHIAK